MLQKVLRTFRARIPAKPITMSHTNPTHGASLETALMLLTMLRMVPQKRFTTAQQIHRQLQDNGHNRDLRTVQRLLDQLCSRFDIERDTRSKPYGYRWQAGADSWQVAHLQPAEALLLRLAQSHIGDFLPTHVTNQVRPLFDAAQKSIDAKPSNDAAKRWLKKVRRIPHVQPLLPPRLRPRVFETLSNALYLEHKVQVQYTNAKGKRSDALIAPLGLVLQEPRLYVVCRFEGYDNERILSLARIAKATDTGHPFQYPKDFDLARYDGEGRFAFGEGKRVQLQLTIDKTIGRHLTESPLAHDQVVEETDEHLIIRATVIDSQLLHAWLRGLGDAVCEVQFQPQA